MARTDTLAAAIEARAAAIGKTAATRDEARGKLDACEAEAKAAVDAIRARHGADALEGTLSVADAGLADLEDAQLRDRVCLVAWTVASVLSADEDATEASQAWLKDKWDVDMSCNSNVKRERFAACFEAFAREISSDGWWEAAKPEVQSNGYVWVEGSMPYDWSPCMGIGVPIALFDRMDAFRGACKAEAERLAAGWAARWAEANEACPEKLAAMRAVLSAGKGGHDGST